MCKLLEFCFNPACKGMIFKLFVQLAKTAIKWADGKVRSLEPCYHLLPGNHVLHKKYMIH